MTTMTTNLTRRPAPAFLDSSMNAKTEAVLIREGRVIARTTTGARGVVSYGWDRVDGAIHIVGTARVSRARKYLGDKKIMGTLKHNVAFVNDGGGAPKMSSNKISTEAVLT
jgi:hypothetical protein